MKSKELTNSSCQTDTVISHPDVVFYDFYQAWTAPNETDKWMYLSKSNRLGFTVTELC
jgi:hypothetical protein